MVAASVQPQAPGLAELAAADTVAGRLAAGMLIRGAGSAPSHYAFSFTPFLKTTYHHGLAADRPVCAAYAATGYCPLGSRCPDRHLSAAAAAAAPPVPARAEHKREQGFNSLVCKHWLRGLCKKGEGCEFLHEYNLRKMPECNFFLRNGYCSNGDECLYLHIDPRSKLPPCPDYDNRGFCALGPACPKKHVRRKAICPCYLAGFCPDGRACKEGAHPKWSPVALVAPQVAAEKAAAAAAAAEAALHGPAADAGGDDDYGLGGGAAAEHGEHHPPHHDADGQHTYAPYDQRLPGHYSGGDDERSMAGSDRTSRSGGDFRGGFNRGRGGRWRGRGGGGGGGGRGFRGRGRGDY